MSGRRGRSNNTLFWDGDLSATLDVHSGTAKERIDDIPKDQFLASPVDIIVQNVSSKLAIEPLLLYEDSMEMEQHEIQVDVSCDTHRNPFRDAGPILIPGIKVVISIPYSGEFSLWKLKPNQWRSTLPHAEVSSPGHDGLGYVSVVIEQAANDPQERIKAHLDDVLGDIKYYIQAQSSQIESHNTGLQTNIKRLVEARKERLQKHNNISDILNIPLKRNSAAPTIKPIVVSKKLVKPLLPAPRRGHKPEPGIASEDYEHMLSVVRHEGATFETTPATYAVHDEEELRDIMLAHLNGHYKGGATGETFRKSGKTDIRIENENRAAFIAECKIWRGQSELTKAVDQLLSYLTWRDCKTAIIVFNKHNANFTELLGKTPRILKEHSKFNKYLGEVNSGEWKFSFMSQEDDDRLVEVRVFLFNIFVPDK